MAIARIPEPYVFVTATSDPAGSLTGPGARDQDPVHLPGVRRVPAQVARTLSELQRVGIDGRGGVATGGQARRRPRDRRGAAAAGAGRCRGEPPGPAADRHRRVRSRARRRPRARLADPDRRRPGHRQVDAHDHGARAARRPPSRCCWCAARSRRRRCACAPSASAAPAASACIAETDLDLVCQTLGAGEARRRRDRLGADALGQRPRVGAGLGRAGARGGRPAAARRQGARASRSCWSVTSPRTAPSPGRACSSTWSTPC